MALKPSDCIRRSDIDGDRHLVVINSDIDCTGWRLEVRGDGPTYVSDFEMATVYGTGAATNLIGHGEERQAWIALMDWGCTESDVLLPDGSRRPLTRESAASQPSE